MLEPQHTVVVRFDARVAPRIRQEHASWMRLTDNEDGSLTARFGVSAFNWITGWVLSYGSAAQVLEPPELIARVRQAAAGALAQYAE
jgi:predicted DNA-binding transcriptional regulator YafY